MTTPPPAQWIGWHLPELAGVAIPLALAATTTPWLAVLALPVASWWTHHELRLYRQRRAARKHLTIASSVASTTSVATTEAKTETNP